MATTATEYAHQCQKLDQCARNSCQEVIAGVVEGLGNLPKYIPLIRDEIQQGSGSLEKMLATAILHNLDLQKEVVELRQVAPFKISCSGKILIWRCPEDRVPIRKP